MIYVCVRCGKVHRNSRDTCTFCAGPVRETSKQKNEEYWARYSANLTVYLEDRQKGRKTR